MSKNKNMRTQLSYYFAKIIGLTNNGLGIAHISKLRTPMLVHGAFPPDEVIINTSHSKRKRRKKMGRVCSIQYTPWKRIMPFCEHFGVCGGCSMQTLTYRDQLEIKLEHIRHLINPLIVETQREMKQVAIEQSSENSTKKNNKDTYNNSQSVIAEYELPILFGNGYYYRNRVDYTFGAKKWIEVLPEDFNKDIEHSEQDMRGAGFHVKGFYDRVVQISHCFLHSSNDLRNAIHSWCIERDIEYYDSRNHTGWIRGLTIRNTLQGKYMVILIVAFENKELLQQLIEYIKEKYTEVVSIYSVINETMNDSIQDIPHTLEFGSEYILEECQDLSLKIYPHVFYQTNSQLTPKLYGSIVEIANLQPSMNVLDLYCGIGSISLFIAKYVKTVMGVEIMSTAIQSAKENAVLNNISNADFMLGSAEDILVNNKELIDTPFDLVIVDPPRAGLHPKVIKYLQDSNIPSIVYVSCNPTTLESNLRMLSSHYVLKKWQAVDMFPHTHHVECVTFLERK